MSIRARKLLAVHPTLVLLAAPLLAADGEPTFYRDVLPLLQENCQTCHRPSGDDLFGMVAPMSFLTYEETRPWARAIAKQTGSRAMPPWHASPAFDGVFVNERTLAEDEIAVFAAWAAAGAPAGAPADAPEPVAWLGTDGWSIGKPDLVLTFDEPFLVEDAVRDHYENISIRLGEDVLPEDRYIKAMQFKPDSDAVHHIVMFANRPGDAPIAAEDAEGGGLPANMLGGFGPGTDATVFPPGYGRLLRAGSILTFNMHYHKEPGPGTAVWDRSEIAFTFWDEPVRHNVAWNGARSFDFEIPANHPNWVVGASAVFSSDVTLMALFPHMHLRGSAATYWVTYPDGERAMILDVPKYDFDWQTNYIFREPLRLPAGSRLDVQLVYDNSPENAARAGFDPNRAVHWGGPTTDEMAVGFYDYTLTDPAPPEEIPSSSASGR
ncbi:MAG: hypothetical protein R3190_03255 [Thermoanaerobaculia bacterium]|nr:hypothetical protein [Thermoanaerobaculia bacterium]